MKTIYLYRPEQSQACGYLEGRRSSSLYADPNLILSDSELSHLSRLGFRRSGHLLYRPACPDCQACQSFRQICQPRPSSRSQKRLAKRFKYLTWSVERPYYNDEVFQLFKTYIEARHSDGDMYPASVNQFNEFLVDNFGNTFFLVARDKQKLAACIVIDVFDDGLSSVYSFYDVEGDSSLGSHAIHQVSLLTHCLGLDFHYLGFYIHGCQKMAYKARFLPGEIFNGQEWMPFPT